MSTSKSNLSTHQYDLVLATTAKSINANLKRWLHHQTSKKHSLKLFFKQVEYPDDSVKVEIMTPEEYQQLCKISGVDVLDDNKFKPGNYSSKDNDDLKKFNENNEWITIDVDGKEIYHSFQSVVCLEMGLPKSRNRKFKKYLPDIVELGAHELHFTLTFSNYKVVEFSAGRRKASLAVKTGIKPDIDGYIQAVSDIQSQPVHAEFQEKIRQQWTDKIGPYFRYTVALSTSEAAFEALPEAVKTKIKNLHGDDMFALDQLYLDLTTAKLLHFSDLGLSPKIKQLLASASEDYFKVLDQTNEEGDNAFIFGYFVKKANEKQQSTLIPTDLDFMVSPYVENHKGLPSLNTLNYLVMTNDRAFPAKKQAFEWNWTDKRDENIHGAIAIRRKVFADYLKSLLVDDGRLSKLLLMPRVNYSAEYPTWLIELMIKSLTFVAEPTTTFTFDLDESDAQDVLQYNQKGSTIFNINWWKTDSDTATAGSKVEIPFKTIDLTCSAPAQGAYSFDSNIRLEGNTIIFFAEVRCSYHIRTPKKQKYYENTEFVHWRLEKQYKLSINNEGSISIKKTGEPIKINDDTEPNKDMQKTFEDRLGFRVVKANHIGEKISAAFIDYTNHIDKYINEALSKWVFPGTNTFLFSQIQFSDNQDLVATLTYKIDQ